MRRAWPLVALAVVLCAAGLAAVAAELRGGHLRGAMIGELHVTEGQVVPLGPSRYSIDAPKVRAVLRDPTMQSGELRFRYRGPTSTLARLDDGEARQQLGLKLRALDACNVVYVMWRIQPRSELAVQVKHNPGLSTSRECGANGYRKLPVRVALPRLGPGAAHTLGAELRGGVLEVRVDGRVAWKGELGDDVPPTGPVGLRTDNVAMDFELAMGPGMVGVAP